MFTVSIAAEEMAAKLRAATATRGEADWILIGRTDARGVDGLDAAIDRAHVYLDAGADWIFPEALQTREEFVQFAERVAAPLVANMTEFGKSPLFTARELFAMGYAVVLYPVTLLRLAMHAIQQALPIIADTGTQAALLEQMLTRQELYDLLEYADYEQRDRAYFSGESGQETN